MMNDSSGSEDKSNVAEITLNATLLLNCTTTRKWVILTWLKHNKNYLA